MKYLRLTLPTLDENLALDEALLLEAEAENLGEMLRIWEWPTYAVVLGAAGRLEVDVDTSRCQRESVPISRRSSGGGTVLLGPGCFCFSLILGYHHSPVMRDIHGSYRWILNRLTQAMHPLLPGVAQEGICDLAVAGRKFSGNAQQRKRNFILHHGTILHDFDLPRIAEYLKQPEDMPEYRRARDHLDFVMNLPADRETIIAGLRKQWQADEEVNLWPEERLRQVLEQRFHQPDWVNRR